MKSKTKKADIPTERYEEALRLFEKAFSEFESDKSLSVEQRAGRLEGATGLFSWLLAFKLDELAETENWYVGILLSASFLEDVGKRRLKLIFKERIDANKIDRLRFEEVIMLLLASGEIDCKMYQQLMEVREARNKLAHDPFNVPFSANGTFKQKGSPTCKGSYQKNSRMPTNYCKTQNRSDFLNRKKMLEITSPVCKRTACAFQCSTFG
jgi:hypothetical protein